MATSTLGSSSTTRAVRTLRREGRPTWLYEPATTWALVSIRSSPTGQAEPATAPSGPPQPYAITRETSAAAARTPAVSALAGSGSSGRSGIRLAKGLGNSAFCRNCCTLARKAGGSGAMVSRARSIADPLIWPLTTPRELLAKVKPRNQAMKSTPTQLVKLPATESQVGQAGLQGEDTGPVPEGAADPLEEQDRHQEDPGGDLAAGRRCPAGGTTTGSTAERPPPRPPRRRPARASPGRPR